MKCDAHNFMESSCKVHQNEYKHTRYEINNSYLISYLVWFCVVHLRFLAITTRLELCISWAVCVAQWLECPTCPPEVRGSIPRTGRDGFFLRHSSLCSGFVIVLNFYSNVSVRWVTLSCFS